MNIEMVKTDIDNIEFFLGDLKASNYNVSFIKGVENLIKENKDLKERLENRRSIDKELEIENKTLLERYKNTMDLMGANYIHKDKVKAMLEGITKEHSSILSKDIYSLNDKNIATFQYNAMRKILEELLKEGE